MSTPISTLAPLIFLVVGKADSFLYDINFNANRREDPYGSATDQFQCWAALESLDNLIWNNTAQAAQMFCRVIEKTPRTNLYAFVGANHTKLLLLSKPNRNEEGIKQFLTETYELIVKVKPSVKETII